jgi:protein phosphatase
VCYGKTDPGVARPNNEDAFYPQDPDDDLRLFIVADGVGGRNAGEVASELAVETVAAVVRAGRAAGAASPSRDLLRQAVRAANRKVFEESLQNVAAAGMATTLTALFLDPGEASIVHVGDCRLYRWRPGARLEQLTRDHTWVQTQIDQGLLTTEQATRHPWRNRIERALGLEPDVELDQGSFARQPGDRYLLCSDGLVRVVSDEEIAATLASDSPPVDQVEQLIRTARDRGAPDNVTIVIVRDAEGLA